MKEIYGMIIKLWCRFHSRAPLASGFIFLLINKNNQSVNNFSTIYKQSRNAFNNEIKLATAFFFKKPSSDQKRYYTIKWYVTCIELNTNRTGKNRNWWALECFTRLLAGVARCLGAPVQIFHRGPPLSFLFSLFFRLSFLFLPSPFLPLALPLSTGAGYHPIQLWELHMHIGEFYHILCGNSVLWCTRFRARSLSNLK